jgi:hypothetical protein
MTDHSDVSYRNLPPDLASLARAAQASMMAAAIQSGDVRVASHFDVARHEAGHVVGSALLGGGTRHCWVRRVEAGWIGYTEPRELPAWGIPPGSNRRVLTPQGSVARAVFFLSGPFAERENGGGAGLANLAADLPEMLEGLEAFRMALLMAMFPDAPPADDGAEALVQSSFLVVLNRLFPWLMGALQREGGPLDAVAAKLVKHGRLAAHEIAPLVRSITPISPVELFDHLRQGLAVGPLPQAIPPAYLDATQAPALGSDVG